MENMYNITFKGYFETEKADEFMNSIREIMKKTDTHLVGQPSIYELPQYIDYQKCEDGNKETKN